MNERKTGGLEWIDVVQHRDRYVLVHFKHNNELSGSIKCREFLDQLRNY
jgi:hypothetical protein